MANTLYDKVVQYTGGSPDATSVSNWLTAGARQVIDLMPKEKLFRISTQQSFTTSLALTFKRILNLLVNSYPPRQVDYSMSGRVLDTSSIHYALSTDPVYWISGGTLYVAPVASTGVMEYVAYPVINGTESFIQGYPIELEQLVILYTAIQVLIRASNDSTAALIALSAPSFSSTLAAPSFTYTDATLGNYVNALIGSFGTAPAWSVTISDNAALSLSGITIPTVQAVPDFSLPFVSVSTGLDLSAQYTELATAFTNVDIELTTAKINEIQTRITEWQTNVNTYLKAQESQSSEILQKEIAEYQATINQYSTQLETVKLDIQRQVETYTANLSNFSANTQKTVSLATNALQASNIAYQAEIQKQLEQVRLTQQSLMELAKDTTNVSLANEAQTLSQQVHQYAGTVQKYQSELSYYSSQIQLFSTKVQEYQAQYAQIVKTIEVLRAEYQILLGAK